MSVVKNYNLTYSFYKNVFSWGYPRAPDGCSQATGALKNTGLILTANPNLSELRFLDSCTGLNSYLVSCDQLKTYTHPKKPLKVCNRCKAIYLCNISLTRPNSVVFSIHSLVFKVHKGKQLFWFKGRTRRKLMQLYGFQVGLKFRWVFLVCVWINFNNLILCRHCCFIYSIHLLLKSFTW